MAIVRMLIKEPEPPTDEEIRKFRERAAIELAKLDDFDDSDIVYDEDCPKQTDEELARFKRVYWSEDRIGGKKFADL